MMMLMVVMILTMMIRGDYDSEICVDVDDDDGAEPKVQIEVYLHELLQTDFPIRKEIGTRLS